MKKTAYGHRAFDLLCWRWVPCPEVAEMDKSLVKFARDADADPTLLVWRVPATFLEDAAEGVQTYTLPIMSRPGRALYAIPDKVLLTVQLQC